MDKKDFLEKTYAELSDNIKFSEAKNAAMVTLNTALIAASVTMVFNSEIAIIWQILIAFFAICLIIPLSISLYSFIAKMDHDNDSEKFMYFSRIYKEYYKKNTPDLYYDNLTQIFDNDSCFAEKQLAKQIVDFSGVAYKKFQAFNIAVKIEIGIFVTSSFFALIVAICKLKGVL